MGDGGRRCGSPHRQALPVARQEGGRARGERNMKGPTPKARRTKPESRFSSGILSIDFAAPLDQPHYDRAWQETKHFLGIKPYQTMANRGSLYIANKVNGTI